LWSVQAIYIEILRFRIDSSIQPIVLVIELEHDFIDHTVIRALSNVEIGLVNPFVNSRSSSFNTKYINNLYNIEKIYFIQVNLNTELHQKSRCRFALHKPYVDPVDITAEASFSG